MNRLLLKILLSRQGKWQFIIAGLGFGIGMLILLLSLQLYTDLKKVFVKQEEQQQETSYLMINKQVSLLNTLDKSVSGFSEKEITKIDSQEVFLSVGEFLTNSFGVEIDLKMQLGFNTDIFFEAVPDEFIDNKPDEFKWEEESGFVPVIIPTEFLNLYNFGFAMSQGLPQLPEMAIQMMPFTIKIKGKGKTRELSARVVAFSERVPSVIVPYEFMKWANERYGSDKRKPSRLIVEVDDPGDERIKAFLEENKYMTNQERLKTRNAGTILKVLVSLTAGIGILFVILSFIIFVVNFQLIIARAKQEIDTLLNLGYTAGSINSLLNFQLAIFLFIITAFVLGGLYLILINIHTFLAENGIILEGLIAYPTLIVALAMVGLMLILNSLTLRYTLR